MLRKLLASAEPNAVPIAGSFLHALEAVISHYVSPKSRGDKDEADAVLLSVSQAFVYLVDNFSQSFIPSVELLGGFLKSIFSHISTLVIEERFPSFNYESVSGEHTYTALSSLSSASSRGTVVSSAGQALLSIGLSGLQLLLPTMLSQSNQKAAFDSFISKLMGPILKLRSESIFLQQVIASLPAESSPSSSSSSAMEIEGAEEEEKDEKKDSGDIVTISTSLQNLCEQCVKEVLFHNEHIPTFLQAVLSESPDTDTTSSKGKGKSSSRRRKSKQAYQKYLLEYLSEETTSSATDGSQTRCYLGALPLLLDGYLDAARRVAKVAEDMASMQNQGSKTLADSRKTRDRESRTRRKEFEFFLQLYTLCWSGVDVSESEDLSAHVTNDKISQRLGVTSQLHALLEKYKVYQVNRDKDSFMLQSLSQQTSTLVHILNAFVATSSKKSDSNSLQNIALLASESIKSTLSLNHKIVEPHLGHIFSFVVLATSVFEGANEKVHSLCCQLADTLVGTYSQLRQLPMIVTAYSQGAKILCKTDESRGFLRPLSACCPSLPRVVTNSHPMQIKSIWSEFLSCIRDASGRHRDVLTTTFLTFLQNILIREENAQPLLECIKNTQDELVTPFKSTITSHLKRVSKLAKAKHTMTEEDEESVSTLVSHFNLFHGLVSVHDQCMFYSPTAHETIFTEPPAYFSTLRASDSTSATDDSSDEKESVLAVLQTITKVVRKCCEGVKKDKKGEGAANAFHLLACVEATLKCTMQRVVSLHGFCNNWLLSSQQLEHKNAIDTLQVELDTLMNLATEAYTISTELTAHYDTEVTHTLSAFGHRSSTRVVGEAMRGLLLKHLDLLAPCVGEDMLDSLSLSLVLSSSRDNINEKDSCASTFASASIEFLCKANSFEISPLLVSFARVYQKSLPHLIREAFSIKTSLNSDAGASLISAGVDAYGWALKSTDAETLLFNVVQFMDALPHDCLSTLTVNPSHSEVGAAVVAATLVSDAALLTKLKLQNSSKKKSKDGKDTDAVYQIWLRMKHILCTLLESRSWVTLSSLSSQLDKQHLSRVVSSPPQPFEGSAEAIERTIRALVRSLFSLQVRKRAQDKDDDSVEFSGALDHEAERTTALVTLLTFLSESSSDTPSASAGVAFSEVNTLLSALESRVRDDSGDDTNSILHVIVPRDVYKFFKSLEASCASSLKADLASDRTATLLRSAAILQFDRLLCSPFVRVSSDFGSEKKKSKARQNDTFRKLAPNSFPLVEHTDFLLEQALSNVSAAITAVSSTGRDGPSNLSLADGDIEFVIAYCQSFRQFQGRVSQDTFTRLVDVVFGLLTCSVSSDSKAVQQAQEAFTALVRNTPSSELQVILDTCVAKLYSASSHEFTYVAIRCILVILDLRAMRFSSGHLTRSIFSITSALMFSCSRICDVSRVKSNSLDARDVDVLVASCRILTQLLSKKQTVNVDAGMGSMFLQVLLPLTTVLDSLVAHTSQIASSVVWKYLVVPGEVPAFAAENLFQGVCDVLLALLKHRPQVAYANIATFNNITRLVLSSVVRLSGGVISSSCYDRVERLFEEIGRTTHSKQLNKYIPYILVDYVQLSQKYTLAATEKRALRTGVFYLMSSCTEHGFQYLYVSLNAAGKVLFKTLHDQFHREFKFTGMV